jgi:hypothetical protein
LVALYSGFFFHLLYNSTQKSDKERKEKKKRERERKKKKERKDEREKVFIIKVHY